MRILKCSAAAWMLALTGLACAALPASAAEGPGVRIVGGNTTTIADWPWMVALVVRDDTPPITTNQFCGGALIAPNVVLTAGHCSDDVPPSAVQVVAGRTDLSDNTGERLNVSDISIFPAYNPSTASGDIAIWELSSSTIQTPIKVAAPTETSLWAPGTTAWVTGWGDTTQGGVGSNTLREVDVPIMNDADCTTDYGSDFEPSTMVCAGYPSGGKDACQGDSGGPLVAEDGAGGWRSVGVVSWGEGCAQPNQPGVYSRIGSYGPGSLGQWIADELVRIATPPEPAPQPALPPQPAPANPADSAACKSSKKKLATQERTLRSVRKQLKRARTSRRKKVAKKRLRSVNKKVSKLRHEVSRDCR